MHVLKFLIMSSTCAKWLSRVWLFVAPWTVAPRLLWPWDSPGKNTRVGCHALYHAVLYHWWMTEDQRPTLKADLCPFPLCPFLSPSNFFFFKNYLFFCPQHAESWFLTRNWTCVPWNGCMILNHWTTREVPDCLTLREPPHRNEITRQLNLAPDLCSPCLA